MGNDISWGAIGVFIGGIVTGLFAWLVQKSKGGTDTELAVLAQWEKLTKGWAERLSAVEKDFSEYRTKMSKEIEELRRDHAAELEKIRRDHSAEIDEMRTKHRTEMRKLREQNDGLLKMIAQNSRSTAQLMGDTPVTQAKDDSDARP